MLSDSEVISISVEEVNDAPVLLQSVTKPYPKEAPPIFRWLRPIADSNPLTYSLVNAPAFASVTGSTLTFAPNRNPCPGSYTFTVVVSDGQGGEDSETITVTVPSPMSLQPSVVL